MQVEKYRHVAEIQAGYNFLLLYLIGWLVSRQIIVMADASSQAELAVTKVEFLRLRGGTNGGTWLITMA